jgi:hypothetical protein
LVLDHVAAAAACHEGCRSETEQQGVFADSKHVLCPVMIAGNNAAVLRGCFDGAV